MNKIEVVPVGYIKNSIEETGRLENRNTESIIILSDSLPLGAFSDLAFFSHLEIIFYHDLHGKPEDLKGNLIPAKNHGQAKKNYGPGLFGTSIVKLEKIDGVHLNVKGLDALNGTLVIDIKPVMSEFLPKEEVHQPDWSKKISGNY